MDRLNNITTGNNGGRKVSPDPARANPFYAVDNDGGKHSHLNEQQPPIDSLRRENFYKITTDHEDVRGSAGHHRQMAPDGPPYSNKSGGFGQANEPSERVTKAATTTTTTSSPGWKWFEWAQSTSSLVSGKPGVELGSSVQETRRSHAPDERGASGDADANTEPSSPSSTPEDRQPRQSSSSSSLSKSLKQLMKMARKHYLISIVCLSLVMIACLLASVVISRSIGEPDLEVDTTRDSGRRQAKESLVADPLEVRTIELVDLMECGKTFAYIRWRVQVRVPRSSATYRQHLGPPAAALGTSPTNQQAVVVAAPSPSGEKANNRVPVVVDGNDDGVLTKRHDDDKYDRLAGASVFVSDPKRAFSTNSNSNNNNNNNNTNTMQVIESNNNNNSNKNYSKNQQVPNKPGQRDQPAPVNHDEITDLNLASSYSPDPLELAANEMSVSLNDMNNTIVDCFLVDVEKRPEQKRAIERRHNEEAITRRVDFKSMLTMIQGCRSLTLTSLANQTYQQDGNGQTTSNKKDQLPVSASSSIPTQVLQAKTNVPSGGGGGGGGDKPNERRINARAAPALTAGQQTQFVDSRQMRALNEQIKPVERPATQATTGREQQPKQLKQQQQQLPSTTTTDDDDNNNPFGSLVDALIATLARSNDQPKASVGATSKEEPNAIVDPVTGVPSLPLPPSNARQSAQLTTLPKGANSESPVAELGSDDEAQRASYVTMGMSMMSGIVPNTLWCGLGDRAKNYSELGSEYQVDACCRAHDHCPIRLAPFSSDYQLINWSMSTRSHCDCDTDFNECLSALNTTLSNVIKVLYFRFVGLQCIDLEGRKESSLAIPPPPPPSLPIE